MAKRMITVCLGVASVAFALSGLEVRFPLGWPDPPADLATDTAGPDTGGSGHSVGTGALQIEGLLVEEAGGGLLSLEIHAAQLAAPDLEPLALCILLDTSGSMKGERKLVDALDAISELLGWLNPQDRLALVSYSNDAATVLELEARENQSVARTVLAGIRAGGATNISDALEAGERILDGVRGNRRIILLSDGIPNRGLSDSGKLIARVSELRERGIALSAIGLGINYNEDLLAGMADAGGGDYAYCKDGQTMANALSRELLRARGIVAADVTAEVELPDGVRPAHFYGRSLEMDGPRLLYRLSDLIAGERRDLLVRVTPARGPIQVRIRHRDLVHRQQAGSESRQSNLVFAEPSGQLQDDPEAVAKVELGLTCSAVPKAVKLAAMGRRTEALGLLDERISGLSLRTPRVEPVFGNVLRALEDLRVDLSQVSVGDAAMRDIEIRSKLLTRDCR